MGGIVLGYGEGKDVASALEIAVKEANERLQRCIGCIKKVDFEITSLPTGAYVYITVAISGDKLCDKKIIGVNVKSSSKKKSIEKALKLINPIDREIADYCIATSVSPLLSIYATVIVGINKLRFKKAKNVEERRERIKKIIRNSGK